METISKPVLPVQHVRDIMSRDVLTVQPDLPVREVARRLWERGVGAVPVVDESGHVLGLVSASDLLRLDAFGAEAEVAPEGAVRVRDVMMPATFAVRPDATVPELAHFLLRAGIHRALVLSEGRLEGIVTSFDILRVVAGVSRPGRRDR